LTVAGLVSVAALAAGVQIPAWLDDGITKWNDANPGSRLQFIDMKDSFAWFSMPVTPDVSGKEIRGRIYALAYNHGYQNTQDEEIVTTARPPSPNGVGKAKKCWMRSFLRDLQKGGATTDSRMLTAMVCEDSPSWAVGFRTAQ
jgi:hypothetical protein